MAGNAEPERPTVELRIPETLLRPPLANFVQSSIAGPTEGARLATLTFVHIYPVPTADERTQPQGEVVARVTMTRDTAVELRDLLIRQLPLSGAELTKLRGTVRRRRTRGE